MNFSPRKRDLIQTDCELLANLFWQLEERGISTLAGLEGEIRKRGINSFADLLNYTSGPACDDQIAVSMEELLDRLRLAEPQRKTILTSSKEVGDYLANKLVGRKQEEFWALYINNNNHIIAEKLISQGTLNKAIVHPRDVFRWAFLYGSAGIIVAHNHPSGLLVPSPSDLKMTRDLQKAAKLMRIDLLDHFIVGCNHYFSMRENELF